MRRPALFFLFALLLAGCGGEKVASPTGPVEGSLPKAAKGESAAGKKVFLDAGCGGCHIFAPAASKGTIGPSLDETLKGGSADSIRQSIVDPNAEIAAGFQPSVMRQDYGSELTPKQIADLVSFLQQGT